MHSTAVEETSTHPLLHDVPAAAQRLGIGITKTYELIRNGEIVTVRIGRRRMVPEASLVAYVERLMDAADGGTEAGSNRAA